MDEHVRDDSWKLRRKGFSLASGLGLACLLAAPAHAQVLTGDGTLACGAPHVVESGDTLSVLSGRAYGDPMLYMALVDANSDVLGGNPDNVSVGMELAIPCLDLDGRPLSAEAAAEAAATMDSALAAEGPLTEDELLALFGPVALFPDVVLSNVLIAATVPIDVVQAGRFLETSAGLSDAERAKAVEAEAWDESVQQLAAAFPDLLSRMNQHIDWTEQAGEAVVAQTDDVLAAIQSLRTQAQENGYLADNDAQNVEVVDNTVHITPASPNVVYVPTYDSQVVYTTPISSPPVYHYGNDYYDDDWDDALLAGGIFLGSAIILDEIFDDDDWGGHWDNDADIDWDGGDINIDRGDRGDITIGGGDREINIGDGNREGRLDGQRLDGERRDGTQRGDRDLQGLADRPNAGGADRRAAPDRVRPADAGSRDAARKKIETRKTANQGVAKLPAQRPSAQRQAQRNPGVAQPRAQSRSAPVSRPSAARAPKARSAPSNNAFRSSGGSRQRAASSRGRSGGGGGGGRRGGGGGRR